MVVTEAFVDNVKLSRQKKVVNISSENGRITGDPLCCGLYWYRMSKAALNKLMRELSVQLKRDGVTVILFDPGATRVEKQANFDFPGMIATAERLGLADTGKFFFSDGRESPW
jgi:NAD(P)-dependent dehydrogenase (short-subunit alcohol dehydrogenase family)